MEKSEEKIINQLTSEFNLRSEQVTNTVKLIDDGNTIPFIARYRKEATGSLSDEILRDFYDRLSYLRNLEDKKEEIKRRMLLPTMFPWRKKFFYCVMTDRSDKVILPQKNPAGG